MPSKNTKSFCLSEKDCTKQIERYAEQRPRYQRCARVIRKVLEATADQLAPQAIVMARAKAIASFAEKCQRPGKSCPDPAGTFTDLCGARVITHTQDEVRAVCKFIERSFEIDEANSIDVGQRHKPPEFGYRSVHYIVQFKPGVFPNRDVRVRIPSDLYPDPPKERNRCPMKMEIQVRTLLEHAWADFSHERTYKRAFRLPRPLERELFGLAAVLEIADGNFDWVDDELRQYFTSYGAHLTRDEMLRELEVQRFVRKYAGRDWKVAHRIGRLALGLGDWDGVIEALEPFARTRHAPVLRDLGFALCMKHKCDTRHRDFKRGQRLLERAIKLAPDDCDARCSLGGTWKKVEKDEGRRGNMRAEARQKAKQSYVAALGRDPDDPYALGNYLEYEIGDQGSLLPARLKQGDIRRAMERCQRHADAGINLPWAYYDEAKFSLLLGKPAKALEAYTRAVDNSQHGDMVSTSLQSLDVLAPFSGELPGFDLCRLFLQLARASRFPECDSLKLLRDETGAAGLALKPPVVIVAGGCDPEREDELETYRKLLADAFDGFEGTVVSGGTKSGVSGMVGDIAESSGGKVRAFSYLPETLPADAEVHKGYDTRRTPGGDFSPLEPMYAWAAILLSSLLPYRVRLLGINGGVISAAEYRMALALGARVGILRGSGREAGGFEKDPGWKTGRLTLLEVDAVAVRDFVAGGGQGLSVEDRERLAEATHEEYRKLRAGDRAPEDPALRPWARLSDSLKESNRGQVDGMVAALEAIGCAIVPAAECTDRVQSFEPSEIELMAQMEHARWNLERFCDGWTPGERDPEQKVTPYMVDFSQLPSEAKENDYDAVVGLPERLIRFGFAIVRKDRPSED